MRIRRLKPIELMYKRALLSLVLPYLQRGNSGEPWIPASGLKRVLFLRPDRLGDMLISLPVFDALHAHFPKLEIGIVTSPRNVALVKDDPRFFRCYVYRRNMLNNVALMRRLRKDHYDAVVDMICHDSVTAVLMAELAAPGKPRFGVGKTRYVTTYNQAFDYHLSNGEHIIPTTLQLLEAFGIDRKKVSGFAPPHVDPATASRADTWWSGWQRESDLTDTEIFGVNFSAGAQNRIWPTASYATVMRSLLSEPKARILCFAVGADRARAQQLAESWGPRVAVIPKGETILFAAALLKRMRAVLSPDTSLIHIARSFGVPVLGLYNLAEQNFSMWRPYAQQRGALISDSPATLDSITPEMVTAELAALLEEARVPVS